MSERPASTLSAAAPLQDRESLELLAARFLTWMIAGVGAAALLMGLLEQTGLIHSTLAQARLTLGALNMTAAALGHGLIRRGYPRHASSLLLSTSLLILLFVAYQSGLGVHTLALVACSLLIALAGGVAGMPTALAMALTYAAAVVAFAWMEGAGWIPGQAAAAKLLASDRAVSHLLTATAGLLAAALMHRILGSALTQALREREHLGMLVRHAHNWDWEADAQLRMRYVSPNFEALTGQKIEVFMNQRQAGGAQLVEAEDLALLREDFRAKRAYRDRVTLWRCPDGSLIWSLDTGEPIFDASGKHTGWRGVSHNITARKLAEQAHRRTADMLDRLVRVSPDPICVARVDNGKIMFANEGFYQFVGLPEEQVLGRSGLELGLWADEAQAYEMRRSLRERGQISEFRSILHLSGARWRDVLISGAAFDWDDTKVSLIIARDITESERARLEGEAILDNASVGIALMRGQRFARLNPQWLEIFGGSELPLVAGQAPLPTPQDISQAAQAFERDFLRPDGRRITVRFNARALPQTLADRFARGQAAPEAEGEVATIWVTEDVTERRRQERELAKAKREAESASAAKGAFLATMSHEIRTPLNGVLGLAKLVQQTRDDDPRRQEYIGHLVGSAEALNEIVSNVLDLSKIEAGALLVEQVEFDLHALVHAAFEGSALLGRERGLTMDCHIEPGVPRLVLGDSLRVRQIIANFLGNALKFTERGGISLEVAAAPQRRIRIAVHDTGVGVPAALQGQLFRPFAQADASTTRRFGGSGLGLSICRELAERMDGQVGVSSDGANGSTFWAELRLPEIQMTPSRPAELPRYPLAGLRLLVAEDNPVNLLIVTALLQRLGAEVVEAEDGARAVQLAIEQAGRLDAVLMDLHMPIIDGLQATHLLRAAPATAKLPIHAFTAAALDQERQAALAAGMNGFLTKPVVESELIRLLCP